MPGDSGTTLGLDLFELYRAGKQSLPAVAAEYSAAGSSVSSAGTQADPLFVRPDIFGGSRGPACAEWMELQRTIERFLKDTSDNIDDTGAALILAANTYASTDTAAGNELNRLKRENGMG